jgi:hypothetical protein
MVRAVSSPSRKGKRNVLKFKKALAFLRKKPYVSFVNIYKLRILE